jgi:thioredoxin reductase
VGAITIGLGDVSRRSDLPRLSDELETTVPGIFVAGELGGMALIRNAVEQGARAMEAVGRRGKVRRGEGADVLVVGSGPAGLAATLKAIELDLSYVAVDRDDLGGTVRKYPRRKLVMTQPVELPLFGTLKRSEYRKEELIGLWDEVMRRHQVRVRTGVTLLGATPAPDGFEARTSQGPLRARSILLALGRRGIPRKLGVPGEDLEKVLYQLVDAATYRDLDLLVVGGGDSAVEAATALADQEGNRVTLSYRKEAFFRLKARNAERVERYRAEGRLDVMLGSAVERIAEDHVLMAAKGATRRLRNAYTFVFAGGDPPYPLLKSLGVGFWGDAA